MMCKPVELAEEYSPVPERKQDVCEAPQETVRYKADPQQESREEEIGYELFLHNHYISCESEEQMK